MEYRIKQISKDVFLPQARMYWFTTWKNIRHYYHSSEDFVLYNVDYYEHHCVQDTQEKAQQVIDAMKEYLNEKSKYPKYHKVK